MEKENLHNPTLRVLDIFIALHNNKNGLIFSEISKLVKIPKGTLHPILMTLVNEKFLQISNSKFQIGKNCFKIGTSYIQSLDFVDIIKPHMKEIVLVCDEICQLGILDGADVLYIEKIEPKQAIRLESYMGKNLPAYATALGQCLLSGLSDDEIKNLYPNEKSFFKFTKNTILDIKSLLTKINDVRKNGYAYEVGQSDKEIECVGVALKFDGKIKASISVSLPIYRSNASKINSIIEILKLRSKLIEKESKFILKIK